MDSTGVDNGDPKGISWKVKLAQRAARIRSDISFAFIDAVLLAVAYSAALVLRMLDLESVSNGFLRSFALALPLVVGLHLTLNLIFGAYGHVWEYASIEEALRLIFATLLASGILVLGVISFRQVTEEPGPIPLTVIIAGSLISLGGMGALRFRSRLFSFKRAGESAPVRTLVVGTGRPAAELARHGPSNGRNRSVVGFLNLDEKETPRHLAGRPVLGSLADVAEIVEALTVEEVIVATSMDDAGLRSLVDACMGIAVRLRILPDLNEVLSDSSHFRDVRDLELEDLLPRQSVIVDLTGSHSLLAGTKVLVTGAGGSIGSEMVRQLLEIPARVIALDHDETLIHDAMLSWTNQELVDPVLCDVRDETDLKRVLEYGRPDVVFHAAALKHVPILERFPGEAVKTNVFGTSNLIHASEACGVSRFVLVSTDKAVDPESVLGATKRIAEMLIQSAAHSSSEMKFGAVRFGNVLGSRGSVVPTFMQQIRFGGPVTITDPNMTRYFMTVPEAIGLVLQTAALAEKGEVFVLDMGEPARIEDLAHRMIRLAGLVPGRDIQLEITGARPGEKTREILSIEPLAPSAHPRIKIARPGFPGPATMHNILQVLAGEVAVGERSTLKKLVRDIGRQNWQPDEIVDLTDLEEYVN